MTTATPITSNFIKSKSNNNKNTSNNNPVRSRTPMSDYGHFAVPPPDPSEDDLDSNQPNLLNTSTSEEEEEEDEEETATQMSRSSLTSASRKLQSMYNPSSVDSFGSGSPPPRLHVGSPLNGILPNFKL